MMMECGAGSISLNQKLQQNYGWNKLIMMQLTTIDSVYKKI